VERVAEYKRQARECKEMAARAQFGDVRDRFMRLAKQWCDLAREREAFLKGAAGD
jgi:hypothetical protein